MSGKNKVRWRCNLGIILAERRRDGLPHTRSWLAGEVNISRQQVGNIIDGMDPHLSIAKRISKAVGKPINIIWPEEEH
jgi:DNA-binding XRE family transcriptional regulator